MDRSERAQVEGMVSARKCAACGHHEMGITAEDGAFYPLRSGMRVLVLAEPPFSEAAAEDVLVSATQARHAEGPERLVPWVPEPVRGFPLLRAKYGVLVEDKVAGNMTGDLYEAAYMEKLRRLIADQADIPIAVLLDRFFTAPHLASGNPREIALAMWRDLEELRNPVERVKRWLSDPGDAAARALIGSPASPRALAGQAGLETLAGELEGLTLEDFLELL